jgi:hypothetical protein
MGRPTIDADDAGESTELTITIDKGNKQWVARIDGTDAQYDLNREFISPYGQGTATETVDDGTVIERCHYSHSGNEKGREYYVVAGGELHEVDGDVEDALDDPDAYLPDTGADEEKRAAMLDVEDEIDTGDEDSTAELATDGGVDAGGEDDANWIDADDFAELALEYRDEMLKSLGVVGIEHSLSYSAPGEEIRRVPVETAGCHKDAGNTVGTDRILTNVRGYDDPDHEVPSDADVDYLTVRETTGYAAIQSSATMALGWGTIPTPREIRLAEHLVGFDETDVTKHHRVNQRRAAEEIVEQVFPRDSRHDERDLWLEIDETAIGNVEAVEQCVSALRFHGDDHRNHLIRYWSTHCDRGLALDEEADGPLDYRLSTPRGLIVEKYFDNPRGEHGSESWYQVYVGRGDEETDAEIEATGYITAGSEEDNVKELDTRVVTIPEMQLPQDVLNLPTPAPRAPQNAAEDVSN